MRLQSTCAGWRRPRPRGRPSPSCPESPSPRSSSASSGNARAAARDRRVEDVLRGLLKTQMPEIRPHPGPAPEQAPATGGKSGALRAAIFGLNDGLISNLSLIMGVTGAVSDNKIILIAGVLGLLAGAFSMGAGEYSSMRVQREVFERLIHLEAHELATEPEEEREELAAIYRSKGLPPELATEVATALMRNPQIALETHAREELGLDPDELGSPWGAAGSSFVTFAFGAFVPL